MFVFDHIVVFFRRASEKAMQPVDTAGAADDPALTQAQVEAAFAKAAK